MVVNGRFYRTPPVCLHPSWRVTPSEYHQGLKVGTRNLAPRAIVWRCFCDPMFSHFGTKGPRACDVRTVRQTHDHSVGPISR